MPEVDAFSGDYLEARRRFVEAALERQAILTRIDYGGVAPDGSPLTIDVAEVGDPNADRLLIISSGLHGVEGFLGSALQLDWLRARKRLPSGVRVALIHAIDAHGFAWLRRCDEANIDLNRNFLDDGERFEGSHPLYRSLDSFFNPKRPPRRISAFPLYAIYYILKFHRNDLRQAIAEGQYDYPQGLFFGGKGVANAHRLLADLLPKLVRGAHHVLHLDVHTGLGRSGHLVLFPSLRSTESRVLQALGGIDEFLEDHFAEDEAYTTRGDLGGWCAGRFAGRDYLYLCAEFGTYSGSKVVGALRAENQAEHHGASDSVRDFVKRRIREVFAPASHTWREQTLTRGARAISVSLESLASLETLTPSRMG